MTFKGYAGFDRATFEGGAGFSGATFKGYAGFELATFKNAQFSGVTFEGGAQFTGVTFEGDARFDRATFKGNVPVLGPFAVDGRLDLDAAQFASPVRIEADASELTCRRGAFPGRVRFELRRALVRLDDTDLSVPSLLTGPSASGPAGTNHGTNQQPSLLSLQRANVAGLVVGNVNLAACRFAGAHNLDKLRLEAGTVFGLSPAVAGWERRQIIAEEAAWRADRARPGRWNAPEWPDSDDKPQVLSPGAVAVLYRALRKSREDAKDEPGAADFYYGEMEMRRHDLTHLQVRPVIGPFGRGSVAARVRIVGQAQIGTEDIDAGLPVLLPVISQPRHGMHTCQPHRWLVIAELGCDRREALVEDPGPVMNGVGLGNLLPPVGHNQGD